MLIVGHRGASYDAPENTLAAINLAWKQKADWVEIDIYLSKDNKIMVNHDRTTGRTGGQDLNIINTASDELRKLDLGSHKGAQYAGEKMPFLEEVLATIPDSGGMLVEIKSDNAIIPVLKDILEKSGKAKQVAIITFDLDVAADFKQIMPSVPVYWLRSMGLSLYDQRLIDLAKKRGLDGLDLHYGGLTKEFRDQVKAAGLALHIWTVDDAVEAKRVYEIGIDGLTTNRPGWIREQLGL